jgi:phosphoribosylglycinamide formyltransferase-1
MLIDQGRLYMGTPIGILCSGEGLELAALIQARDEGRLPADIRLVICDSHNEQLLNLARSAGLYAAFVPRGASHANVDGYERRLVEMMRQAEVEVLVLAGYVREMGSALAEAYPGRIVGRGFGPFELAVEVEKVLRKNLFTLQK